EGHASGKGGGSVSQASFGRFIASASRSVPVLEKQRPPRPALRAGDAAKGAMLSFFFMAGAPFLTYLPPSGSWSAASPPAAAGVHEPRRGIGDGHVEALAPSIAHGARRARASIRSAWGRCERSRRPTQGRRRVVRVVRRSASVSERGNGRRADRCEPFRRRPYHRQIQQQMATPFSTSRCAGRRG